MRKKPTEETIGPQNLDDCFKAVAKRAEYIVYYEKGEEYPDLKREMGQGPSPINKPFKIRSDLYSFLFVSSLHAEYIY